MKYHFYGYSCQVTKIDTLYFYTNYTKNAFLNLTLLKLSILRGYIDLTELYLSYCLNTSVYDISKI